jgi:hypothetical protein
MIVKSPLRAVTAPALALLFTACPLTSTSMPKDSGPKVTGVDAPGPVDAASAKPQDILTQRGDSSRTGIYSHETLLTQANVNKQSFGKLFTVPVDGFVWAQPLYVSSLAVGGKTRNVLIVATAHNSVYAFDADAGGSPLWHTSLGPSVPSTAIVSWYNDICVEVGITSTPVIDRVNGLIYIANKDYYGPDGGQVINHRFHVLDLVTGQERKGSPVLINVSIPGTVDKGTTLTFEPRIELQRTGLLLLNGIVYMGFAAHGDLQPSHGFIAGYQYNVGTGVVTQSYAWSTTQDGDMGGVWQGGQGLTADSAGNIYAMVSNGSTTVQNGGTSYAQAFLKMSPSLHVLDYFIPATFDHLSATDTDVGAGGPVLVPGTSLVVGAGKGGILYVVNTANMGHVIPSTAADAGDPQIVQEFQITKAFYGSPLVWVNGGTTRLYIWGPGDPVKQFVLSGSTFGTTPAATSTATTIPAAYEGADPVGILAMSSNGSAPGSAILWASKPLANPNRTTVSGMLYAFDPVTLNELWDSTQVATDSLGNYAKFAVPTVANGKVYMATHSGTVAVYGLKSGGS